MSWLKNVDVGLCVLSWLIRPNLALNCLLQIEQLNSEDDYSDDDPVSLTLHSLRVCSVLQTRLASYSSVPFLIRPFHFARSCSVCSQDSGVMLKSLRGVFRISLYIAFLWPPWERFPTLNSPQKAFFGSRSSGILVTWPVYLTCANFSRVFMFCIPVLFRTSASGILACHLICMSFLIQFVLKWLILLALYLG